MASLRALVIALPKPNTTVVATEKPANLRSAKPDTRPNSCISVRAARVACFCWLRLLLTLADALATLLLWPAALDIAVPNWLIAVVASLALLLTF